MEVSRSSRAQSGRTEHRSVKWSVSRLDLAHHDGDYFEGLGNYMYPYANVFFVIVRKDNGLVPLSFTFLMVAAAYAAFWMDPNAVPARVGLTFLAMLMVFNNYDSLSDTLPEGEHPQSCWLLSFM